MTTDLRTIVTALRVVRRNEQDNLAHYYEVLDRAVWPPCEAAHIQLMLPLLDRNRGPLILGIEETL